MNYSEQYSDLFSSALRVIKNEIQEKTPSIDVVYCGERFTSLHMDYQGYIYATTGLMRSKPVNCNTEFLFLIADCIKTKQS